MKTGTSSRHWRSVVRGYWRSLVLNEASRGFPFPLLPRVARLKEGFLTRPPNHVDIRSVSEDELPVRDGRHRTLCAAQSLRTELNQAFDSGLGCSLAGAQYFRVR